MHCTVFYLLYWVENQNIYRSPWLTSEYVNIVFGNHIFLGQCGQSPGGILGTTVGSANLKPVGQDSMNVLLFFCKFCMIWFVSNIFLLNFWVENWCAVVKKCTHLHMPKVCLLCWRVQPVGTRMTVQRNKTLPVKYANKRNVLCCLIECLMALKFIKQDQTVPNKGLNSKMFGHQTVFDGVWSPNLSHLYRPLAETHMKYN